MKIICRLIILFSILSFSVWAQRNDNIWIMGYHYGNGWPQPALDFYFGYPDTIGYFCPFEFMRGADAVISDDGGNLQFYTNGVYVANRYHQLLQGSTNFNYDTCFDTYSLTSLPVYQSALILPFPNHPKQYYLFHLTCTVFNNGNEVQSFKLSYSKVDMNLNGGQGQMTVSNHTVFIDTLLYSTMQATKHGNGRDWWITVHGFKSNEMYSVLLTSDSITQVIVQNVGPKMLRGFNGQSVFSPDGTKYAITYSDSNRVQLYDFDRCTGYFTYNSTIQFPANASTSNVTGCSFSPGSQYLYVSNSDKIFQFNSDTSDIAASQQIVALFDGYGDPFPNYFWRHRLGPDGKIYISPSNGTQHFHVINSPDMPGSSCNVGQHQLKLISYNAGDIPEFANYRLGALSSSICDTISTYVDMKTAELNISVYPNPTTGYLSIESSEENPIYCVTVFSADNRIVNSYYNLHSTLYNFDMSKISQGIYFIDCTTKNGIVRSKVVKY